MPRTRAKRPIAERFWEKVDIRGEDECWPWKARTFPNGYGQFSYNGRSTTSNRIAYFLHNGEFPLNFACHTCNYKPCCNYYHLYDGDVVDNKVQAMNDGLVDVSGENNPRAKLTNRQAAEIYVRLMNGEKVKTLSDEYHVSNSCIRRLNRNEAFTEVISYAT